MEATVRINTVFGAVNIKGELTFSMSKDFINGVKDAWKDGLKASLAIQKADCWQFADGETHYILRLRSAVHGDIEEVRKWNQTHWEREHSESHQVNISTLSIAEVWIEGNFCRILWKFVTSDGNIHTFMGEQRQIHSGRAKNPDEFTCGHATRLNIYF